MIFSSKNKEETVEYSSDESIISILVPEALMESAGQTIRDRFDYLNIGVEISRASGNGFYKAVLHTNDMFTVMRSKKIIESILPDSRTAIESIGGIPYDDCEAFNFCGSIIPEQA
ncbi:MAG: hypothetical protein ACM3TR_15265 [Caulobacteraceae bacterium]